MATIRISILGPVRAVRDGVEIRLGSPQQRCVLALVTAAGGTPVPIWGLIESLWGAPPPASAANMVQIYVMRLRRLLDPDRPARGTSVRLPRMAAGYALRLAPDEVDLWQFRALLDSARAARRAGHQQQVVGILTQALSLWHGSPVADLPAIADDPSIRAVDNERTVAASWLAEAAVSSGQAGEALAPLAEVARARPLDEALQAHLIRTLHAAGRRSEAVATYWMARTQLRNELGLDPGPELETSYQALIGGSQFRMSLA